jgi:MOSC domain-containing protein YiiM
MKPGLRSPHPTPVRVVSVNASLPRTVVHRGKPVATAIFKEPVTGRVRIERLNLRGDAQADPRVHGGPDKAVYAYPVEHYPSWAKELERVDLRPGQFGENLTIEGILETDVHIGDVLRVGSATLQVTQPRWPCFKLGIRMGSPAFPKHFLASGRLGFYLRVLEEGDVGAGDDVARLAADPARLSVAETSELLRSEAPDPVRLARALAVPALAAGWREALAKRLGAG